MRTLRLMMLPLAVIAGIAVAGCSTSEPGDEESVELSGLQDEIRFTYDGGNPVEFTVKSNRTWSISKSAGLDWLTVDPINGGAGNEAKVTVTASPNEDLERSGSFVFNSGSVKRTVNVLQEAFPIVPELTVDLEEKVIPFEFNDIEPVRFTVRCNVAWKAEKKDLDWLKVDPSEGERKTETVVTVTPSMNEGAAREGVLTFKGEGASDVQIKVTQTAFVDDPFLTVSGLPEGNAFAFKRVPESPVTLKVQTNRNWTAVKSAGLDWLTVSPDSGVKNSDGVNVTLTAAANTSEETRTGTVTFKSSDGALADVVVTVSQEGYVRKWIWTLEDSVLQESKWASEGKSYSDDGKALMEWIIVNEDALYSELSSRGPIVSSKQEGHYAYKQIWKDDNLQFTVPVEDLPADSKVSIQFAMSGTKYAPAFWNVEFYDNGEWTPTSISSLTSKKGYTTDATFVLGATDAVVDVKETAVFTTAVANGEIRLRVKCTEGKYLVDNTNQSKAHKSGTIRFRQWSDGTCNEIRIQVEK
ncbi:MAG: BACON domain-containing protein [Candidatus Cryptobacteroides sp.]